jgi:hypothetical protein
MPSIRSRGLQDFGSLEYGSPPIGLDGRQPYPTLHLRLPDTPPPLPRGYRIESLQVSRVGLDPEHDTGDEPDGSRIFGEHRRRARCTEP